MAIYRSCVCLELNKSRVHSSVDERSVDILDHCWCATEWPVTAVSDSQDSKPQHSWGRSGTQVSASQTQPAASVTQFFCLVYEA